jgi:hypothetical protein
MVMKYGLIFGGIGFIVFGLEKKSKLAIIAGVICLICGLLGLK